MQFNESPFYPNLFNDADKSKVASLPVYPVLQYLSLEYDVYITQIKNADPHSADNLSVFILSSKEGFFVFKVTVSHNKFITVYNFTSTSKKTDTRKIAESDNPRYLIKRLNKLKDDKESKWMLGRVKEYVNDSMGAQFIMLGHYYFSGFPEKDLTRFEYQIDRILKE